MTSKTPSTSTVASTLKSPSRKLIEGMIDNFREKHKRLPGRVVVTPSAALLLTLSSRVPHKIGAVVVECRQFGVDEVLAGQRSASGLGVFYSPDCKAMRCADIG